MIKKEKYNHALYAIHQIFVRARFMAYKEKPYEDIAELLDYAEMLPRFFVSEKDETELFKQYLESIAETFPPSSYILQNFDSDASPEKW